MGSAPESLRKFFPGLWSNPPPWVQDLEYIFHEITSPWAIFFKNFKIICPLSEKGLNG
jgi:hypothetical protein